MLFRPERQFCLQMWFSGSGFTSVADRILCFTTAISKLLSLFCVLCHNDFVKSASVHPLHGAACLRSTTATDRNALDCIYRVAEKK